MILNEYNSGIIERKGLKLGIQIQMTRSFMKTMFLKILGAKFKFWVSRLVQIQAMRKNNSTDRSGVVENLKVQ